MRRAYMLDGSILDHMEGRQMTLKEARKLKWNDRVKDKKTGEMYTVIFTETWYKGETFAPKHDVIYVSVRERVKKFLYTEVEKCD